MEGWLRVGHLRYARKTLFHSLMLAGLQKVHFNYNNYNTV